MKRVRTNSILWFILTCLINVPNLEGALPFGIFPILTTGWYYKPGPIESVVLGLIIVKVLAIRLGATLAGVPYHLNDIFDNKNLLSWSSRKKRNFFEDDVNHQSIPLSSKEVQVVERILLALKRIDSHDCFIRYICQVHQNGQSASTKSPVEKTWLKIFKLRPGTAANGKGEPSIWKIYADALSPETNCSEKYRSCPLDSMDLGVDTILAGLF